VPCECGGPIALMNPAAAQIAVGFPCTSPDPAPLKCRQGSWPTACNELTQDLSCVDKEFNTAPSTKCELPCRCPDGTRLACPTGSNPSTCIIVNGITQLECVDECTNVQTFRCKLTNCHELEECPPGKTLIPNAKKVVPADNYADIEHACCAQTCLDFPDCKKFKEKLRADPDKVIGDSADVCCEDTCFAFPWKDCLPFTRIIHAHFVAGSTRKECCTFTEFDPFAIENGTIMHANLTS